MNKQYLPIVPLAKEACANLREIFNKQENFQ